MLKKTRNVTIPLFPKVRYMGKSWPTLRNCLEGCRDHFDFFPFFSRMIYIVTLSVTNLGYFNIVYLNNIDEFHSANKISVKVALVIFPKVDLLIAKNQCYNACNRKIPVPLSKLSVKSTNFERFLLFSNWNNQLIEIANPLGDISHPTGLEIGNFNATLEMIL